MDGGAWWPTSRVAKEQDTAEHAHTLESTAVNEHGNFTAALPARGETAAGRPGRGRPDTGPRRGARRLTWRARPALSSAAAAEGS